MKKVIRSQVFESNSSAVHTLVISSDGLEKSKLRIYNDGKIHVRPAYFGKSGDLTTQYQKLQYVITECLVLAGEMDYPWENVYDYYVFTDVQDAICEYTGASGIKILKPQANRYDDGWGLDHQEWPEDGDLHFCNYWMPDTVIDFVFNKYITVHMGCD